MTCLSLGFSSQHSVDAVNAGVNPVGDTSYNSSHWDLGSAFFFAGTVITTIGTMKYSKVSFCYMLNSRKLYI